MGAVKTCLTPEQRELLRAARRAEQRSWQFWLKLLTVPFLAVGLGLCTMVFLWWSACFAPNGWFAWAFSAIWMVATALNIRALPKEATRRRDAVLAGAKPRTSLDSAVLFVVATSMAMWSAISATYVSNFGPTSSEIGPRLARTAVHYVLHGMH